MTVAISVQSFITPIAFLVLFAVLLLPGYALAREIVRRYRLDPNATLTIAFAVMAITGYAAFWCYFANSMLGRAFSAAAIVAGAYALARLWRDPPTRAETIQLLVTSVVGVFYLAVLYLPSSHIGAEQRFFAMRPSDNALPQIFAERLYSGLDPRRAMGGWLSSDRPPLQAGIDLILRPVFRLAGDRLIGYELCGVIAQLVWIAALWALCSRAGLAPRRRAVVLAFAISSGFSLYNTVYVWPKLLAAGFCLAALVFAVPARTANRDVSLLLAAVCAALALLAHGSAAFFLAPAVIVVIAMRWLPWSRGIGIAGLLAIGLLTPWWAYQHFYDPPGDRLVKLHLAGVVAPDARPALQTILDAYAQTPLEKIAWYKWTNVLAVFGAAPLLGSATIGEPETRIDTWRVTEREFLMESLGALNLGWLALPMAFRRESNPESRRWFAALLGIAVASTLFWCLALWGPWAAVTTHSAYATELVVVALLAVALADIPRPLLAVTLSLQAVDLAVTWIGGSLGDAWRNEHSIDPFMAVLLCISAIAEVALLVRMAPPSLIPSLRVRPGARKLG